MTKIFILGEAYGAEEAKINRPFVGASGVELLKMLDEAGVISWCPETKAFISKFWQTGNPEFTDLAWALHPQIYRTNVFNIRPTGNRIEWFCGPKEEGIKGYPAIIKGKYVHENYIPELERLRDELVQEAPNLVLCLGNTALWALTAKTAISKFRGTTIHSDRLVQELKCLGTYHPAAVLREWSLRPIVIIDLMKAKLESEFPEIRRPQREIWIEPTLEDLYEFDRRYILNSTYLSVDIETRASQITCIGFSPRTNVALVIPIYSNKHPDKCYWRTHSDEYGAWNFIKKVVLRPNPRKVFQNGMYDIAFLWRAYGIRVAGAEHDTMLLHHALQPESAKSLDFLGSIYTNEGAWKQNRKSTTIKRDD